MKSLSVNPFLFLHQPTEEPGFRILWQELYKVFLYLILGARLIVIWTGIFFVKLIWDIHKSPAEHQCVGILSTEQECCLHATSSCWGDSAIDCLCFNELVATLSACNSLYLDLRMRSSVCNSKEPDLIWSVSRFLIFHLNVSILSSAFHLLIVIDDQDQDMCQFVYLENL